MPARRKDAIVLSVDTIATRKATLRTRDVCCIAILTQDYFRLKIFQITKYTRTDHLA
jgi:hypothetical protein